MKGKQQDFRTEKYIRYGIRKYSFGAASVAIAAGLMFLGNGAVSATEQNPVSDSKENIQKVENPSPELGGSNTQLAEKTTETPKKEEVKVNKSLLETSISNLETALSNAKYADASVVANAREALATAKSVLANEAAKQEEVNVQKEILSALGTVVTESNKLGLEKEQADKDKVAKEEAERKATPTEKALSEAKSALDKVSSEADVTNTLAATELRKKEVAPENRAAIEAAVAKNQAVLNESKVLLADKSITKEQVDAQLTRLNESILAVYSELKKAGIGRDGKLAVALAPQDFYAEETANSNGTRTTHSTPVTAATATGMDIYKYNPDGTATRDGSNQSGELNRVTTVTGGTAEGLEVVVYSNQRDGSETNPANGLTSAEGGRIGHNNKGRMDYPLTPDMAKKLAKEAELWRGKLRPSGSTNFSGGANVFSNGGPYEFLATEIYKLGYEQGIDRVYIPGIKSRFGVTAAAAEKGWSFTGIDGSGLAATPYNLPNGLVYDATNDVVEGIVTSNIENGVQDFKLKAIFTNSKTGAVVTTQFANMRLGWVGWIDTTPPTIATDNAVYERTVGQDIDIDIKYQDASGARTMRGQGANVSYTKADGTTTSIRQQYGTAVTGIAGVNVNNRTQVLDETATTIPGVSYQMDPNNRAQPVTIDGQVSYNSPAKLSGALTEAGVFYVSTFAKDYNSTDGSRDQWIQSGQETQGNITVVVKPKVEALNIETYSETVPVTISKGATNAVVTMPDGTKTVLQNQNGSWVVVASGEDVDGNAVTTTNTAAAVGTNLGTVGGKINVPVTQAATAKAGVDNIKVEAITENIKATFLRNKVVLTDVDNTTHEATLNSKTGHWELPAEYSTVQTTNADGTYTLTKRQVYTETQLDGSQNFYIYTYKRTFETDGTIKSVDAVTRHKTTVASKNGTSADGMSVTVTYNKVTDAWTASDGSTVTATKLGDSSWDIKTSSGFGGEVRARKATSTDVATIINTKPTATSTSYESTKGTTVDLRNAAQAAVTIADKEDTAHSKTTYITRLTVTSPSGAQKVYDTKTDAAAYTLASNYVLSEVGVYKVVVDVIDSNGNVVTATLDGTDSGTDSGAGSSVAQTTYTITVKDTIVGHDATSSDIQGATQTGTPTFTSVGDGSTISPSATSPAKLVAADGSLVETLKVANEGTYTINPETGVVTFEPLPTFKGTATPVTVKLTAILGTDANNANITATATAIYTPKVVPVTPTAVASQTTGPQGKAQTSAINFDAADTDDTTVNFAKGTVSIDANTTKSVDLNTASVTLLNANGDAVTSVTVENEGTYTLDKATNVITFQPVATFTGTVTKPVSVRIADANGTTVTTTYTPTVTDVTMTAKNATSKDVQGKTQTGTPGFETSDPSVTIATRQLIDPSTMQPTTSVTIANEGTYTIDPTTGVVTFVPVPTFTGEGTGVTVQATDSNGETATATYKPTVTPITITGKNVTSKNIQGEQQSETPLFSSSDESAPVSNYKLVDPATGNPTTATSVTVENVGTYTIDSTTGVVTFQPVATYKGTPAPAPVTVQASATITNEKGESTVITGTATYTPTVVPVAPTAKESATVGKQGQAQTSQIVFDTPDTDATTLNFAKGETSEVLGEDGQPKSVALNKSTLTLLDANGNSVTTVTVDGEGTYTLDKTTNVITFQPTEEFTGKATPVRVQIADVNGTTVTTNYTPTVVAEDGTVIVEYKDEEGNIISPSTTPVNNEKVTTPFTTEPKEIPGYTLVKVETTNGTVDEATKKVSGKVTNEPTTVTYTYRKNVQTATISYYDVTTGAEVAIDSAKVPEASVETVEGVYKGTIDFVHREKAIAALEKAGYTLVEDGFVAARTADKLFDNDTAVNQNFTVTVKQRVEPVTPNDEKPVPGQPVDPENPNSPVWPSTAENLELTKTVTRTIKYRYNDENGKEVTADKVQTVTFTRSASINLVTGNVEYTDWSAAQTLEAVVSPEVANYTYDKKTVPSLEVTNESTDSTVYVIYKPVAPTTTPATSTDIQGKAQTGTPTYKHADGTELKPTTDNPAKFVGTEETTIPATKDGKTVGTYTIDPTGAVTFTPNKDFVGTPDPAKVVVTDPTNGTTVESSYTPTVTPVTPTGVDTGSTGPKNTPQSGTPTFVPGHKDVPMDNTVPATFEDGTTSKTVPNEGTYTVDPTGKVTFTPNKDFVGTATGVTIVRKDTNGTVAKATYTPSVLSEDGTVIAKYVNKEGKEVADTTVVVENEETGTSYTSSAKTIPGYVLTETPANANGTVTNGLTTITYVYEKATQNATITYVDVTTGTEKVLGDIDKASGKFDEVIDYSTENRIIALQKAGYKLVNDGFTTEDGRVYDGDDTKNNFKVTVKQRVEPVTPNDEKPVPGQPVDPENPNSPVWPSTAENLELTKTVTRTIKYRYNDENGKEVTADKVQTVTFTRSASINLVTGNVEYTDWSAAQTLEAVVSPEVANYTYDKKTVPSLEVTNESTDSTVYVIYKPVAPTTTPATSTDIQGKAQTGTPTYKHADGTELKPTTDNPAKFVGTEETTIPATKDGKTVGTYTIDPTGAVTFTPNKDFVGTPDPAKVVVTDPTNGTTVESSYTPTVTPVTPTGVDTGSTGPKNTPQSGTPTFVPGHKDVPMDNTVPATFEDGTTSKTVPNEGTYTVDPTGKVTFTPNKDFVGAATGVTIVRKDTNGTEVKAKYTPTVYEVKSDTQVATVTYKDTKGTILGEVDILQGDSGSEMNYSTAERINVLKKLGYELVSDEFIKADGSKQSFDNDTKAIQKFVVTVQPRLVPVIPSDVTPVPGQPINPEDPNSPVWPESVKELTTSEEVTRTITYVDGDGKEVTTSVTSSVKFTRDAKVNLVTGEVTYGEWKAATTDVLSGNKLPLVKGYIAVSGDIEESTKDQTVKAKDKDIVQKVVYKKLGAWIPNVPGQTNPPRIDYPNDPNGDPTKPGVPTEDIVIPYVPGYIPRDKDGNPLKPVDPEDPTKGYVPPTLPTDPSQDTPINYTKITTSYVTVDPNGKEISIPDYPTVEGNQPKKDIPGYEFVKTTTDKDGNVTHVYRKVVKTTTSFVDGNGNPVSPNEEGNQPKKDIPGYEFVKTTTDKDGNVTHVYRKVVKTTTSFVDGNGNPVSPNEEGNQPKKDIPGYRFVETKKLPNGDIEHVYEKVTPPAPTPSPVPQPNPGKQNTTTWTDENGNPLKPTEPGSKEPGTIPGYEYVKTVTDSNGNIRHIFKKVETSNPVSPQEPETPEQPMTPEMPTVPEQPKQPASPKYVDGQKELPNTGTEANASLAALGLLGTLGGFGLLARKKKED